MLRLPNVEHIGLSTSADSVYIDTYGIRLPESPARLTMSLKVYRNRIRANNEWYTPKHTWKGDVMSDERLTEWIHSMAQ